MKLRHFNKPNAKKGTMTGIGDDLDQQSFVATEPIVKKIIAERGRKASNAGPYWGWGRLDNGQREDSGSHPKPAA